MPKDFKKIYSSKHLKKEASKFFTEEDIKSYNYKVWYKIDEKYLILYRELKFNNSLYTGGLTYGSGHELRNKTEVRIFISTFDALMRNGNYEVVNTRKKKFLESHLTLFIFFVVLLYFLLRLIQ